MSVISNYKARVSKNGIVSNTLDEYNYKLNKDFERTLYSDPASTDVYISKFENVTEVKTKIRAIIIDVSKNDIKSFDEKFILSKKDSNIGYGDYILFDDSYWIVNFKENQVHKAYDKHTIRRCNKFIKLNNNGSILNLPVSVKNLVQYSDGMQDIKYTSIPDSKVSVLFSLNESTKFLKEGSRFFVNENAYKVTFIEAYQYSNKYDSEYGLASLIAVFDQVSNTDIKKDQITNDYDKTILTGKIQGSNKLVPGGKYKYYIDNVEFKDVIYEVEYITDKKDFIGTEIKENNIITLKVNNDFDLIGQKVKLSAKNKDGSIDSVVLKVSVY